MRDVAMGYCRLRAFTRSGYRDACIAYTHVDDVVPRYARRDGCLEYRRGLRQNLPPRRTRTLRAARDKLFQHFAESVVLARLVEKVVRTDFHAAAAVLRCGIVGQDENNKARRGRGAT